MKIWCKHIKCFNDNNNHHYFFICYLFIRANPEGVLLEMSALFLFYGSYLTLITSFDAPIIFLCFGKPTGLHSVSYYLKSTHGKKSITVFGFLLSFIASFVVFQHNEEHDFILSNRQFYYI